MLVPFRLNERSYCLGVFSLVSARMRRFERTQARLGTCVRCPATCQTLTLRPFQLVLPSLRAIFNSCGRETYFRNPLDNPL